MLVLAFVLILGVCFAVVMGLMRPSPEAERIQSRLASIRNMVPVSGLIVRDADLDEVPESFSERLGTLLQRYSFAGNVETLLAQSATPLTLGMFALTSAAAAVLVAGGAVWLLPRVGAALGLAGAAAPYFWLRRRRNARIAAFGAALPDTIELMSRALRAGHSVQQTMEVLGEQTHEPIRGEFAKVHQEQKLGVPFRDAMLGLSHRVPLQDLHFVVTAILVQKETGGDLTDILDRTSFVIRDRLRVKGEIQTYTAQGRLTGWILSLLPVVLLVLILLITPSYGTVLFHDPAGQKLLALGATMIAIGAFIIRRIVDVEV